MESLKAPMPTWGGDIQRYEREKRCAVDEGLLRGPQVRITRAQVSHQERTFDPLLQRYRDNNVEVQQRSAEEKERVAHLNRAQDIQILREQPYHIINQASKLEGLAPGLDPMRLGRGKSTNPGNSYPDTTITYNLISNLPFQEHHWAEPECRPHCKERSSKPRKLPLFEVKDFDIVTNRYLEGDEQKKQHDKIQALTQASNKYMKQSIYDPVTAQFTDPRREECAQVAEHSHQVEANLRAQAQMPPCIRGRESAFYDVLSLKVHNKEMIQLHDDAEAARKDRKTNRYTVEHNFHVRDIKRDHITESRKLNRVAPERFEESNERGYNIVDNRRFGKLANKETVLHEPYARRRLTPWEQATNGQAGSASSSASQHQASQAIGGGLARSASTPAVLRPTPPGRTAPVPKAAPPAPAIPGSTSGSVYSQRQP